MSVLKADYFDGHNSRKYAVSVVIAGERLKIVGRDVDAEFDARGVRRSLRIADTPRWLYLPGGGACVTADNDTVDRMTRDRRYERTLHRWESRPVYAVVAIAMVVATLWLLIDRVLPVAANEIALRIPLEAETTLGRKTLEGMEQQILQPTQLSAARQKRLRAKLDDMARAAGETTPYRLEFRASPIIGPNAFALPSGIIVMTDELVKLAKNDREVLAVLAHELGHVHHRHTMRRLLEGSATVLIIAGVTGDIASAASLAATAPTLLLQTKYSRDNEREADAYAVAMMKKAAMDPRYLGALLARLENEVGRRGVLPSFLSSHPPTEERGKLSGGAPAAAEDEEEVVEEDAVAAKKAPGKHKLNAIDPQQRQVVGLFEKRDYPELERVLGALQRAFEEDEGASAGLENAFQAFDKVPRGADAAFNEWARKYPSSYVALTARGCYFYYQGLDARGTAYAKDTPADNLRAMRSYLGWASMDLEHSLALTPKPYLSRLTLMSINRVNGNRRGAAAQYQEAVKLAPHSAELRVAHMFGLEPRWGGSYREMERFLAESRSQLKDPVAVARLAARVPAYRAHERQQAGDYPLALKLYDESIALHAGAGALCERSYVLDQLQRHDEAFADIKLALSKARDHRYCLDRATAAAAGAKNPLEAIELMTLVIEVDPASVHALNQRGWRQQQLGKLDLAFQDYLASARLGDDWGQLMAGKLLWAGKGVNENREEALEWLRKAAEQGNADAKTSLEQALQLLGKK